MSQVQSHSEIIKALTIIKEDISATVQTLSYSDFFETSDETWSSADYLKHLILGIKPFATAIKLPFEKLEGMFGLAEENSVSYDTLVEHYHARLDAGVKAEDSPKMTPVNFRMPENIDTENSQSYLVKTWNEANSKLIETLATWSDEQLDSYRLPHPALGLLTIREMCYFTIYHNNMHHKDIIGKKS